MSNQQGGTVITHQNPRILVVATLDTKAEETECLVKEIESLGGVCFVLDSSVGHDSDSNIRPEFTQLEVARAAGLTLAELRGLGRGEAVARIRPGITALVLDLESRGAIDGAICIGGAGTHLAGPAFQKLGLDIPKLVVSPLASGSRQFEPYIGTSNIAVMHSVADISGINRVTRTIYRQAAGYIVGAALSAKDPQQFSQYSKCTAASMNGNTTIAVDLVRRRLAEQDWELVAFHANGVGGRAMEEMIAAGKFDAVVDYTATELAGHEIGGLMNAGPARMEIAGSAGIPQVLVPGCLDLITCGTYDEAQIEFPGHRLFRHNPELTLVRLNADQMEIMGRIYARKINQTTGKTTVCIPTRGFSVPGAEGGPFWDPGADDIFCKTVEEELNDEVDLHLVAAHINDPIFVEIVIEEFLRIVKDSSGNTFDISHPNLSEVSP
jgi:uncharacterized protein (UPF0261 family)